MPLVIKEIRVSTVVEKKVVLPETISRELIDQLKEEVREELREELEAEGLLGKKERSEKDR